MDRFLYHYPVYTINYGAGQSVLYIYLAAGLIKLFGFSLLTVRLPALILSSMSMIVWYLLVKDFKNQKLAILSTFFLVIAPWHFMQSRWALDCNLMSSMLLISTYMLLKSKRSIGYILSGILFGMTLYSYVLSYIIVPIFLIGVFSYLLWTKKIKIAHIILFFIPLILLAIPLILNLLVNLDIIEPVENLFFSTPKLWINRGKEFSLSYVLQNLQGIFTLFTYDSNDYNAFRGFGTLYYISIFFFIIGIVSSIKKIKDHIGNKVFSLNVIFLIMLLSNLLCLLCTSGMGISRSNGIYPSLIYFIALGIYEVAHWKNYLLPGILAVYLLLFGLFQYQYFFIYGERNENLSFNQSIIDAVQYVESKEEWNDKKINVRVIAVQPYIYTLIANQTSPYDFHENLKSDGIVYGYGRYLFYNQEIDDYTIYIRNATRGEDNWEKKLLARGFECETYKDLEIFYKNIEQ